MVNDAESRYQLLERSDHVPKEANPNHFNKHDVQVLDRGWAQNISVPHGSKGCDDPVVCGDQIADEVPEREPTAEEMLPLVTMGYDISVCRAALRMANFDANNAMNIMLKD